MHTQKNKIVVHLAGVNRIILGYRVFEIGFQRFYYDGYKGISTEKKELVRVMNPPIILCWII